jgi:hypothetical protein
MSTPSASAVSGSFKQKWAALLNRVRADLKLAVRLHVQNYQSLVDAYASQRD